MENNIDVSKLDLKDLKSLAYDFIAQKEQIERNLQAVNQEISRKYLLGVKGNETNDVPVSEESEPTENSSDTEPEASKE